MARRVRIPADPGLAVAAGTTASFATPTTGHGARPILSTGSGSDSAAPGSDT